MPPTGDVKYNFALFATPIAYQDLVVAFWPKVVSVLDFRRPPPYHRCHLGGRVAQWESTVFTPQGSLVQSQPRPPCFLIQAQNAESRELQFFLGSGKIKT